VTKVAERKGGEEDRIGKTDLTKPTSNKQSTILFGLHAVEALLRHAPERVLQLYVQQGRDDEKLQRITSLAKQHGIHLQRMSRQQLEQLQSDAVHQGVVAEIRPATARNESELSEIIESKAKPFLLVLDGVQDPHNLGACLRTADAAGVDAVIAPRDKAVGLTATVRKVACGAAELVPFVQVVNLSRTLKQLQELGVWIIGAAGEAEDLMFQADLDRPLALVLGAEGAGLRRLTAKHCDSLVKIPMFGNVESLNVSVAAGVLLYEAVRQRR
jgi:23S rRNA (guanosine2251-2'-O)-methyltransferase